MLDNPIVLDSVRLSYAQSGCDPVVKTEAFLVFRFPLTHCGTTVQVRMQPSVAKGMEAFSILNKQKMNFFLLGPS